jgi:hypothetical protein
MVLPIGRINQSFESCGLVNIEAHTNAIGIADETVICLTFSRWQVPNQHLVDLAKVARKAHATFDIPTPHRVSRKKLAWSVARQLEEGRPAEGRAQQNNFAKVITEVITVLVKGTTVKGHRYTLSKDKVPIRRTPAGRR